MPFFHLGLRLNLRHIGLTLAAVGVLNLVPREAGGARPDRHKPRLDPNALAPNRINISVKGSSFDEAVSALFDTAGSQHLVNPLQTSFRIAPSVTAFLDPVTYEASNATLDEALTKLLKAVPDQKTPLTFHKEKDVYIITSGSVASKPETNPVAIGLPSYDPEPTIKKVDFTDAHADMPLRFLFKQSAASYVLIMPTGVTAIPRVTFAMQQIPLEQAVVHLLRTAPSEPALHFEILKASVDSNEPLQSGEQPKPEERLYIVKPVVMMQPQPATPQSMNDFRFSFHFQNASIYDALKMLMNDTGMNYALDPKLRQYKVTVGGDDLLLDAAISKVISASPKPLRTKTINGILDVKAP